MHRATDLPAGISLVGAAAGVWSQAAVTGDSRHAGAAAAARVQQRTSEPRPSAVADPSTALVNHPYPIFTAKGSFDFIDFDEDLQSKDIVNTVKDGYDDIQLVKRYSTAGPRSQPGPSLQPQHHPHRRARDRQVDRRHRDDDVPPAAGAGEICRARRARLRARPPHRHASPAHRARRADDGRRAVDASGVLRRQGRCHPIDRARGAGGARGRRHDRRVDARRPRHPRARRGGVSSSAITPGPTRSSRSGARATC